MAYTSIHALVISTRGLLKVCMKKAICIRQVPSILSPTNQDIEIGEIIEYKKEIFRNGEHHYVLANKSQVPSIFFDEVVA